MVQKDPIPLYQTRAQLRMREAGAGEQRSVVALRAAAEGPAVRAMPADGPRDQVMATQLPRTGGIPLVFAMST